VAEGVETQEQADLLRSLHCDQAQGFLYSRPIAADELAKVLAKGRSLVRN
jgi:EAL domain-containing protein (putative c-di-GMP-specific phosphodiesterase class I)